VIDFRNLIAFPKNCRIFLVKVRDMFVVHILKIGVCDAIF
jgi:hypothetical protein